MESSQNLEDREKRKSAEEIVHALMEVMGQKQKFTDELAREIGSSWETTWKYLNLIVWIQSCPKVVGESIGRTETWRREWGRLPL